jgi:hypothetical protein
MAVLSGASSVAMSPGCVGSSQWPAATVWLSAHANSVSPAATAASCRLGQQSQRPQVIWQ